MKILFVVRTLGEGGASKQLAMTANALASFGHDVSIFSYYSNAPFQKLNETIKYIPQKKLSSSKLSEYLFSAFRVRRVIKEEHPDVVVGWRCNAGCFSVLAAIGLKCKVVFSERTDPYMEKSLALKISAWICGFSDGGVFQLEAVRKYYKSLYSKSIVIPNPIDYKCDRDDRKIDYEKRPLKIAFVGRMFMPQKRQDIALAAFEIFSKDFPDFELHFYGDGRDLSKVKAIVSEKKLEKKVFLHGIIKNITDEIRDARMLLLTSDYEGIPNVILEAFAAGVPVVSTDCSPGGAKFLIGDDENGLLAPIGDAKAIAQKMTKLVDDFQLASKYIENGRRKLQEFVPEEICKNWEKYLLGIVEGDFL